MNNEELISLESLSKQNGSTYWSMEDIASFFGYNIEGFRKVVNKSISFGLEILGDSIHDEFFRISDPKPTYKISRYGVLLCAMFAQESKPNVKEVRIGLATFAEFVLQDVERIEERNKLSHGEKYLSSVVMGQGLENKKMGLFKDAGYRGMYNMSLKDLKEHKGVNNNATLYDFMGLTELAANTFRTTLTADKIKHNDIKGFCSLKHTAEGIGKQVRDMVEKNTGKKPENLAIEPKINTIKTKVKKGKSINQMDKIEAPHKTK